MTKRTILIFALLKVSYLAFSQESDSAKIGCHFGGAATITTKGISTIPNLTLGKPAAIFDMSVGKRKLSFEPSFRFGLNGKPWSFLFWWRYELLNNDKFLIKAGTHPAIAFRRNFPVVISAIINKTISTQIPVGEDFLWNLSLVYTFNKKYVEM